MKIVVTGANGFIGKNLMVHLQTFSDLEVVPLYREHKVEDYGNILKNAQLIFHLAGINRPDNKLEFDIGNRLLTQNILNTLRDVNTNPKFVLASSSQVENQHNPYSKSKRRAEHIVEQAANDGVVEAIIYRLPGVFGKWCKPNYNSVVATYCYNVANKLPLEVRDENYQFPLVYIDDVVGHLLSHLKEPLHIGSINWPIVNTQFEANLGELATIIQSFGKMRHNLELPKIHLTFHKYLYSTYLSFLPKDSFSYSVKLKKDDRGDLFEWIKSPFFGQVFISTTKPGITRGNHYHHTKTEKFMVIRGEGEISFRHVLDTDKEVLTYEVDGNKPQVVEIPPGYTHNITNVGKTEMITLFWANEIFDPEKPDTIFEKVVE